MDCNRLFVYGTLRRGHRLHQDLVRLGAEFEGEAKVSGVLFDLGSYPGARPAETPSDTIVGELYGLINVETDLNVLDEIEEFVPEAPEASLYIRSQVAVTLSSGTLQDAWIYWLAGTDTRGLKRIPSGDYASVATRK